MPAEDTKNPASSRRGTLEKQALFSVRLWDFRATLV